MRPAAQKQPKLNLVIVDPDGAARARFKEVVITVPLFGEAQQLNTLAEAASRLELNPKWDIIFLSSRLDAKAITDFVKRASDTPQGDNMVFVQCIPPAEKSSNVATQMLGGINGMLIEPFSVDGLTEIAAVAMRVKKEKKLLRERIAIKFLVDDIIIQIDRLAFMRRNGMDSTRSMEKLKELCTVIKSFEPSSFDNYMTIVSEKFEHAPIPALAAKAKSYGGASARVRKMLEEKLVQEFEKEDAERKKTAGR